jgi:hypothetical protein
MEHKLKFQSEMSKRVFDWMYHPLKDSFPGTWEEFNTMMQYVALFHAMPMWDHALELRRQAKTLPCYKAEACEAVDCKRCLDLKKPQLLIEVSQELSKFSKKLEVEGIMDMIKEFLNGLI